jgi:Zn-dependent protease with chaperone function
MFTNAAQPGSWGPIPGPIDRRSFFEEQLRHRRSTRRLAALCVLGITFMAAIMCIVVLPLVFAQVAFISDAVQIVMPLPWPLSRPLFGYPDLLRPAFLTMEAIHTPEPIVVTFAAMAALLPVWLPIALTWLGLRAKFLRDGVGSTLLALGAREPRPGDLEENQLENIVAEMAIAAGLKPPRVVILDDAPPNAAVIGPSPDEATVVVARRLLDEFDRDETLGVLGHLIGSAGNGDLRIAFGIASVYQTLGVLLTLLDVPFSREARARLAGVIAALLRTPSANDTRRDDALNEALPAALADGRLNDMADFFGVNPDTFWGRVDRRLYLSRPIRVALFLPLIVATLLGKVVFLFALPFLLSTLLALAWRSRRYLADASSVQLNRNPQGLADALEKLHRSGGLPHGAQWCAHLFVVGTARARTAVEKSEDASGFADQSLIMVDFHPSLEKRLQRLRAQGAV